MDEQHPRLVYLTPTWWGHQIPAWYDNEGNVYVARNQEEAEKQPAKQA